MRVIGKWIKRLLIVVSLLLVLLICAAIALPFFLPLDRIKDFVAAKASETIRREVRIGKVTFNIFTGIGINDIYVGNRPGFSNKPFVKADKVELKYDLWSLFKGKFIVNRIALIGPSILIEERKDGSNYSDLIASRPATKEAAKKAEPKQAGKPPIGLDISSFQIKNASLSYMDYRGAQPSTSGFKNFYLTLTGVTLDLSRPVGIWAQATALYQNKPVPVSLSTTIRADLKKESINISNLKVGAAGEYLTANVSLKGFSKAQNVKFDLSSKGINLDKFLAIISGKGEEAPKKEKPQPSPKGALTKSVNEMASKVPAGLVVNGKVNLNNITFKHMALDSLNLSVSLKDRVLDIVSEKTSAYKGVLNGQARVNFTRPGLAYSLKGFSLAGFDAKPATNDFVRSFLAQTPENLDLIDKVEGTLDLRADIGGSGVEPPEPMKNASGTIVVELKDGTLRKLKSLSGVGDKIGLGMLKSALEIKSLKADMSIAKGILGVKSLHADNGEKGDVVIDFNGKLNLLKQQYVAGNVLRLALSPRTSPAGLDVFKDSSGWTILEFELSGALSRPIPVPKLEKPLEKVTEGAKSELEKQKKKAAEELNKQASKEADALKKGAEEELKKLLKF